MDPNSAAENLQVIRTLMERSAHYRRALAPVMLAVGLLGLVGWFIGDQLEFNRYRAFICFWFSIAAIAIGVSLLIIRRQALNSKEPIWTPPTRQVTKAMVPPLTAGFLMVFCPWIGGFYIVGEGNLVVVWPLLYGCALHSAGLFVSRGVRLLGWSFIICSVVIGYMRYTQLVTSMQRQFDGNPSLWFQPHALMGLTFGGLHLLAGLYLYVTEKRKNAQ